MSIVEILVMLLAALASAAFYIGQYTGDIQLLPEAIIGRVVIFICGWIITSMIILPTVKKLFRSEDEDHD